MTSLNNSTLNS